MLYCAQFPTSLISCLSLSQGSFLCGHVCVAISYVCVASNVLEMAITTENRAKFELEIRSEIRFLNAQNVQPFDIYRQIKQIYG